MVPLLQMSTVTFSVPEIASCSPTCGPNVINNAKVGVDFSCRKPFQLPPSRIKGDAAPALNEQSPQLWT